MKVEFTKREQEVLSLLQQKSPGEKFSLTDFCEVYKQSRGNENIPHSLRSSMRQTLTSIYLKTELNQEPIIEPLPARGRGKKAFYIVKGKQNARVEA